MIPRDFIRAHRHFLAQSGRGDGYWIWKSYFVRDLLSRLPDDAILFYADAGCAINVGAQARFDEWIELCEAREVISFELEDKNDKMRFWEKHWTKMSVAELMNCTAPEYLETGQILSGIFGVKKTRQTIDLIRRWQDLCSLEWTINDSVQPVRNADGFCEHRHDQSIFSLLLKQAGFAPIHDETYPEDGDWNNPFIGHVPVVARRRRAGRGGILSWRTPHTTLVELAGKV